ncbi:MAG: sensory rhodopsin transducer [Phycisphaerales bacterium]
MTTRRPPQLSVRKLTGSAGLGCSLSALRPARHAFETRLRSTLHGRTPAETLEARAMLSVAFQAGPVLPSQDNPPAIIADFNGDGKADMATSSGTNVGMLNIFFGDNAGNFTLDDSYDWGGSVLTSFADRLRVLDMDHDGDQDLISNGPVLWLNDGTGTFGPPTLISFGILATDLVVYNWNNDNLPDIAVVQPTGILKVLQNNSGVNFTTSGAQGLIEPNSRFLTPGRVDGDTQDDLLYWTPSDQRVRTQLYTDAGFVAGPDISSVPTLPIAARLNADAFMDVIWSEGNGASADIQAAFNNGAGGFDSDTTLRRHRDFGYPQIGALADFDNDGKADLLVRRQSNTANEWAVIPGDGLGNLDTPVEVRVMTLPDLTGNGSVVAADFTGDGRADMLRFAGTTISTFRATAGPTIAAFNSPTSPVLPGRDFILSATGLGNQPGRTTAAVRFYEDTNQNSRLDLDDLLVGTATPSGIDATLTSTFGDRRPWGTTKYFAVAEDSAGGASSVSEDTSTLWTRLFFPEGWRNIANVNEHVPMANPHEFSVQYQVILHYERPDLARDYTFETGTIPAHTRWGVTTALRGDTSIPVVPDAAYAFEVLSSAPIAAQLARYDTFNIAISGQGESFTNRSTTQWGFGNVTNTTLDFVLFFNPFSTTANVDAVFYPANGGSPITIHRVIPGFRRSGIAIQEMTELPANTDFSVVITADQPIAVSESRYAPSQRKGMAAIGQDINAEPNPGGASNLVITGIDVRAGVNSPAVFFNPGDTPLSFTLTGTFEGTTDVTTSTIILQPKQRTVVELTDGVPSGATTGNFAVNATSPVLVSTETVDFIRRDSLGTTPATYSSREWAFGDGWLDPNSLGVNSFASITLYNPTNTPASVDLRFLFDPAEPTITENFSVPAFGTRDIRLDQLASLANKPGLDWYSTVVTSSTQIVASMTHWDLYQPGGWTTLGVAIDSIFALPGPSGGGG